VRSPRQDPFESVEDLDDLAAVLRRLRARAAREQGGPPLSYRELAARTGWAYGSFSGYFRGGVLPPADRLDTLLQLLGATDPEQAALATARDRLDDRRRGIIAPEEWAAFPDTGSVPTEVINSRPAAPSRCTTRVDHPGW